MTIIARKPPVHINALGERSFIDTAIWIKIVTRETTDSDRASNGGDYNEWETWTKNDEGNWECSFFSSYDDGVCPYCGNYTPSILECSCSGMSLTLNEDEFFSHCRKNGKSNVIPRWDNFPFETQSEFYPKEKEFTVWDYVYFFKEKMGMAVSSSHEYFCVALEGFSQESRDAWFSEAVMKCEKSRKIFDEAHLAYENAKAAYEKQQGKRGAELLRKVFGE